MKKTFLTAAFLVAFAAGAAIAGTGTGTGVVGSAHDMNTISGLTDDAQGRVCAFCHTPHHSLVDPNGENQPLWSHQYTGYVANVIPYQSPTFQAVVDQDVLMGPSRLCMSCHDGVVAADQHYGGTQTGSSARLLSDDWNGVAIGKATDGTNANFGNDHPIGFNYNDAVASDVGGGLFPSTRTFIGNTNNATLKVSDVLLNGDFMTCATCHDVHNKDNANNAQGGMNYFVYAPQENSSLCLTCHNKGNGVDAQP